MMGAMLDSVLSASTDRAPSLHPRGHHNSGRTLLSFFLTFLAAFGFLLAAGETAVAHSELATSSPADGATLGSPPAAVSLTFNEPIMDAGLQVVANGPSGRVALDAPVVTGPTLSVTWPSNAPDGEYQVAYRVVSADGHPIDGSIRFSYTGGTGTSDALGQGQSAAANATPPPVDTSGDQPFRWWAGVLVVLTGVGIGAGIAYYLRSRARTHSADQPTP